MKHNKVLELEPQKYAQLFFDKCRGSLIEKDFSWLLFWDNQTFKWKNKELKNVNLELKTFTKINSDHNRSYRI